MNSRALLLLLLSLLCLGFSEASSAQEETSLFEPLSSPSSDFEGEGEDEDEADDEAEAEDKEEEEEEAEDDAVEQSEEADNDEQEEEEEEEGAADVEGESLKEESEAKEEELEVREQVQENKLAKRALSPLASNLNFNYLTKVGLGKVNLPNGKLVAVTESGISSYLRLVPGSKLTFTTPLKGGKTTPKSKYVRTELSGSIALNVNGPPKTMTIKLAVTKEPTLKAGFDDSGPNWKGVVIGQIKNQNTAPGSPLEIYYKNGEVYMELHNGKTVGGPLQKFTYDGDEIDLGEVFTYSLTAGNGKVWLLVNGTPVTPEGGAKFPKGWDNAHQRWKAGSYCNALPAANVGTCAVEWSGFSAQV